MASLLSSHSRKQFSSKKILLFTCMYFKFLSTKYVVRKIFVSVERVQTVSKPTFVSASVSRMPVYMLKTKNKKNRDQIFLEARKTRSKLDRLSTIMKQMLSTQQIDSKYITQVPLLQSQCLKKHGDVFWKQHCQVNCKTCQLLKRVTSASSFVQTQMLWILSVDLGLPISEAQ